MPSSYKNLDLFSSGPHRFHERRRGQTLATELSLGIPTSGTRYLGPLELSVEVRGTLIAGSEAALWTLRDAITAQLLDPPAPGALKDHHNHQWTDMSFVRFEPEAPVNRGRQWSLAYRALFIDFKTYPQ